MTSTETSSPIPVLYVALLLLTVSVLTAQDQPQSQSGTLQFTVSSSLPYNAIGPGVPGRNTHNPISVGFAQPFCGTPSINVTLAQSSQTYLSLFAPSYTVPFSPPYTISGQSPTGFQVAINDPVSPQENTALTGNWTATGSAFQPASIVPKYLVYMIVYAPPGTKSSVIYTTGLTQGTTVSSETNFTQGYNLSVGLSTPGQNSAGAGTSVGFTQSVTDKTSISVKDSSLQGLAIPGPGEDQIDHGFDRIYLLLNPAVNLSLCEAGGTWALSTLPLTSPQGANLPTATVSLYVHDLMPGGPMDPNVAATLASYGITPADYPGILQVDPLAGGLNPSDPSFMGRFVPLGLPFPQAYAPDPNPQISKITLTSSVDVLVSQEKDDKYTVGFKVNGSAPLGDVLNLTVNAQENWEWVNKHYYILDTRHWIPYNLTSGSLLHLL